jgi:mRNA-degrading endonuclease RelE of RelBE toxin-antitoxin system
MAESLPIQLIFTSDFQTQIRRLTKRYRHLRADLQHLFDELESGNCPGDQISGTTYTVFKVRVKNRDIQKGKSGGYRVIYQRRDNLCILLITLYSKSDESTLTAREIREIIDAFNKLSEPSDEGA